MEKWKTKWNALSKSSQVFLTLGIIWMVMGLGYDDYVLKLFGVIFLLSGLLSLVKERIS